MTIVARRASTAAALAVIAVLGVVACSSGTSTSPSSSHAADPTTNLVGAGCAGYAARVPTGAGSMTGMAQDPVAVAMSHNPLLTTLTSAVSGTLNPNVNLVDTLDGAQFTVFAPVDDAFAKLPAANMDSLKSDAKTLTDILTYHVVPGQLIPTQVAGIHKSVDGNLLTVSGAGDTLSVNGAAVICGDIQTANATVYLIDTVLIPGPTGLHPDSWHAHPRAPRPTAASGMSEVPTSSPAVQHP